MVERFSGEWKEAKLGEIGTFIKGANLSKADISSSGTPFILYGELYTTYKEVAHEVYRRTRKTVSSKYYSRVGDVIIPTSSEVADNISSATCVMIPGVILAGDLCIFRTSKLDGRFLSFALNHIVKKQIAEIAQGITIIHVRIKDLENITVRFPPLEEQHAIADTLSAFDRHISALSALIAKKQAIRQGALEDLMTGRTRLSGFCGSWKTVKLGDVLKISRGASPRPIEAFLTSGVNGVNWIKIGDASKHDKYITKTAEKITEDGAAHSIRVKAGDFILSNSMSFGRPYILRIDGCIHDGWLRLYDYQDSVDSDFLYYVLSSNSTRRQYITFAAGSGVQNLNKEVVKQIEINLPSLDEQLAISSVLTALDSELSALKSELAKFSNIRHAAISDLLTGKTRLERIPL